MIPLNRTEIPAGEPFAAALQWLAEPRPRILAEWEERCGRFLGLPGDLAWGDSARWLLEQFVRARLAGVASEASEASMASRRVLVPAFICAAVPEAVRAAGGQPEAVDVDPASGGLDPEAVRRALTRPAAALVAAPLFGVVGALPEVIRLARGAGVPVLADCAQAFAPESVARLAGCEAYLFSFAAGKHLPLFGGGLIGYASSVDAPAPATMGRGSAGPGAGARRELGVLARSMAYSLLWRRKTWRSLVKKAADESRRGAAAPGVATSVGRFPTASAALGLQAVGRLSDEQTRRRENARTYHAAFEACGLISAVRPLGSVTGLPLLRFPVLCATAALRGRLVDGLWRRGLWASTTDYADARLNGRCPGAAELADRLLTLPVHGGLQTSDIERIADWIAEEVRA